LFPEYRNIFLLAKQAITLQEVSNGRLEFRTGAGATLQWSSQWWHPYGIDYPNNVERVSILDEAVQILDKLWNKQTTTVIFEGKHFKVNGAALRELTNQKRIPVTIAAKRNKTMEIAAKYGDIWESSYITPEQFALLNKKFDAIYKEINNNDCNRSKKISKSIELDVIIADSDSDLEYKKRIFAMERGPSVAHQILKHGLVGKPDEIQEKLKEYMNVGVDQFFLAFQDPFDHKALDLFMNATAIR
jgi:alkanesulfonate monooxygenase SsuD/methylene tetrahydromethanopterin reductase-like flavin-dependent oxidoreductase (luciferase family)